MECRNENVTIYLDTTNQKRGRSSKERLLFYVKMNNCVRLKTKK